MVLFSIVLSFFCVLIFYCFNKRISVFPKSRMVYVPLQSDIRSLQYFPLLNGYLTARYMRITSLLISNSREYLQKKFLEPNILTDLHEKKNALLVQQLNRTTMIKGV